MWKKSFMKLWEKIKYELNFFSEPRSDNSGTKSRLKLNSKIRRCVLEKKKKRKTFLPSGKTVFSFWISKSFLGITNNWFRIAYFANSREKLASCLEKQLLLSHKFYSQGIANKSCLNFLTSQCTQKGRDFLRNVQCTTQNFYAFCRLRPCKWLLGSPSKMAHSSCMLASPLPGLSWYTKPKTRSI